MIVTNLKQIHGQINLTPNFQKAIDFLENTDLSDLPEGRVEIDGKQVYGIVSRYRTRPLGDDFAEIEGHIRYADIHYLISGEEAIGWVFVEDSLTGHTYNDEKDIWKEKVPLANLTWIKLSPGQLGVFYRTDAHADVHAPQNALGEQISVKKIVVKIAI